MDRALFAAASGMAAQQANLDTIANNLANADVVGFKESEDVFSALAAPGEPGAGTVRVGEQALFKTGKLERSNGPFDVAIDGDGFFVLTDGKARAYTRAGEFSRASDGTLRTATGWQLAGVRIPADAVSASVTADGAVTVTTAMGTHVVAHLRLAEFAAPEHLQSADGALFMQTTASGPPRLIAPGGENGPNLRYGMLEQSNVSIVESMMQILTAQRAYEANAKGIQAADEMLRIANNLQRG
ncbi:MAG TPA: flagellar hook-basal body complex protein [Candidatus Baltobacteraceae bacterium]|nr:flagellar hook-basal body complex protein [Candidatus Baltobacteraceae bacterium]